MACASCSFARSFAQRSIQPLKASRRALSINFAPTTAAPSPANEAPSQRELLHITKKRLTHSAKRPDGPCSPNTHPPAFTHADITRRLGIKHSRPVIGNQEWQTSTYTYNKNTQKSLPIASQVTDKLLFAYAALRKMGVQMSSRTGIAGRRKSADKMYVSGSTVKDFGSRMVVNAFIYDEAGAQEAEMQKREDRKQARTGAGAGRRRGPPREDAGGAV